MFDAYKKLSGCDIEDSIKGETSGNLESSLLAVGKARDLSGRYVNRKQRGVIQSFSPDVHSKMKYGRT